MMKKAILYLIILAFIASLTSCTKESTDCDLVAAKIIRYDCDRVIFQLLTSKNIGDADWMDRTTQVGYRYKNVVSYYNSCAVNLITNGRYDTLYVKVKKTNENSYNSSCVQCLAISVTPPITKVDFTEISKSPCEENPGTGN